MAQAVALMAQDELQFGFLIPFCFGPLCGHSCFLALIFAFLGPPWSFLHCCCLVRLGVLLMLGFVLLPFPAVVLGTAVCSALAWCGLLFRLSFVGLSWLALPG